MPNKAKKPQIPKFSEIYPKPNVDFNGEKKKADDLVGETFIIKEYSLFNSKFDNGQYAVIQIEKSGCIARVQAIVMSARPGSRVPGRRPCSEQDIENPVVGTHIDFSARSDGRSFQGFLCREEGCGHPLIRY